MGQTFLPPVIFEPTSQWSLVRVWHSNHNATREPYSFGRFKLMFIDNSLTSVLQSVSFLFLLWSISKPRIKVNTKSKGVWINANPRLTKSHESHYWYLRFRRPFIRVLESAVQFSRSFWLHPFGMNKFPIFMVRDRCKRSHVLPSACRRCRVRHCSRRLWLSSLGSRLRRRRSRRVSSCRRQSDKSKTRGRFAPSCRPAMSSSPTSPPCAFHLPSRIWSKADWGIWKMYWECYLGNTEVNIGHKRSCWLYLSWVEMATFSLGPSDLWQFVSSRTAIGRITDS